MATLTPTTVQIRTSAGVANVAAFTDGTTAYIAHATVDDGGNLLGLAQDATLQSMTESIQKLVQALSGQVVIDPGTVEPGPEPPPVVSTDAGGIWTTDDGAPIGLL